MLLNSKLASDAIWLLVRSGDFRPMYSSRLR